MSLYRCDPNGLCDHERVPSLLCWRLPICQRGAWALLHVAILHLVHTPGGAGECTEEMTKSVLIAGAKGGHPCDQPPGLTGGGGPGFSKISSPRRLKPLPHLVQTSGPQDPEPACREGIWGQPLSPWSWLLSLFPMFLECCPSLIGLRSQESRAGNAKARSGGLGWGQEHSRCWLAPHPWGPVCPRDQINAVRLGLRLFVECLLL